MQSISESTNLREGREWRLLVKRYSEWSVMKEAGLALWGRRLRCGIVVLPRGRLISAQTCWKKSVSFSWKRAVIILKYLNIFFVVSPNFDPLAHAEIQCGCKGECDFLLGGAGAGWWGGWWW